MFFFYDAGGFKELEISAKILTSHVYEMIGRDFYRQQIFHSQGLCVNGFYVLGVTVKKGTLDRHHTEAPLNCLDLVASMGPVRK